MASLLAVDHALASLVSYTEDRRQVIRAVTSGGGGNSFSVDFPPAPFADWVNADQISSMNGFGFSAEGSGDGSEATLLGNTFQSATISIFDITFFTPTPVNLNISGILTATNSDSETGGPDARFSLFSGDNELIENLLYEESVNAGTNLTENTMLDFSSFLPTGDYRIVLSANGGGRRIPGVSSASVSTSYSISGSLSAVPVPAAVWLFGSALIGFVAVSRRRKVA